MIEWTETIAAPIERVWPLLADPARWPEWLASDGPYVPADTITAGDTDGVILATAANGQQATWQVAINADQYTVECNTGGGPVLFTHQLHAAPADGHTDVTWFGDYQLPEFTVWQRIIMTRHVANGLQTMQMYSLLNLKELAETPEPENEEVDDSEV